MSRAATAPVAVYYEHPEWFRPLFAELERRGVEHVHVDAGRHRYDPRREGFPYALLFNRMSPSAWQRGRANAVFYTLDYLRHLERLGVRVVNGHRAYAVEISKARQLSLLKGLGVPAPRARVINHPGQAAEAAVDLRLPVVFKPNIGGSGAGVRRFDSMAELERAADADELDFGIDRTGLIQEFIPPRDDRIVRVEVVGGEYLYAIRIYTTGETFDLCPADVCRSTDGRTLASSAGRGDAGKESLQVEGYEPPREIVERVEGIMAAAHIEVGGIEYFIDDRDGQLYFYDINALSNFVADATTVIGFDPFSRLVDFLMAEAGTRRGE